MEDKLNLENLLKEREQLDDELHRLRKWMAIIFIDIKGSTDYFDKWGDIEGAGMVKRCRETIFPFLEGHSGLRTIGDGVMSYFNDTGTAVKAAVEIQKALLEYNADKEDRKQIHIRIGINAGYVFEENNDLVGDEVNVAARVESLTEIDGIYITKNVYEKIKESRDFSCNYVGERTVKGKSDPLTIYQIIWRKEETGSVKFRGGERTEEKEEATDKIFYIEFNREGEKIRIKSYESGKEEAKTLNYFEDFEISSSKVEEQTNFTMSILRSACMADKADDRILTKLKESGYHLYNEFFSLNTRERLNEANAENLILNIDDSLINIPWELIFDGTEFLCQRFNIGRVVSTRSNFVSGKRELSSPLKMLVIADPQGNLPASFEEGQALREKLTDNDAHIDINIKNSDVSVDFVEKNIKEYDLLHYAGHADFNDNDASLILKDGNLKATDTNAFKGAKPMPSLVFLNACHSGRTEKWKGYENVYSLANAFLIGGVRHFIGTFWEVEDDGAMDFALFFYSELNKGAMIGEAVKSARLRLIDKYGEKSLVWSSYLLYGDPTFRYIELSKSSEKQGESHKEAESKRESSVDSPKQGNDPYNFLMKWLYVGAALMLIVVIVFVFRSGIQNNSPAGIERNHPLLQTSDINREKTKKENKENIDKLVAELIKRYREEAPATAGQSDEWTSAPLALAFLGISVTGISESEREYILNKINEELYISGRIQVVDRALLDKLLEELKLGSSELADPATALKIGRVLSARLISTGKIVRDKNDWMMTLRIIETETTSVKAAVATTIKAETPDDSAKVLAGNILDRIIKEYPLQGNIVSVTGNRAIINIGSNVGVEKGMEFEVLSEDDISSGTLKVVSVQSNRANVKSTSEDFKINEGLKVREIQWSKRFILYKFPLVSRTRAQAEACGYIYDVSGRCYFERGGGF